MPTTLIAYADGSFSFEHGSNDIFNPAFSIGTVPTPDGSDMERGPVSPAAYGFTQAGPVWVRAFVLEDGTPVQMTVEGADGGWHAVRLTLTDGTGHAAWSVELMDGEMWVHAVSSKNWNH